MTPIAGQVKKLVIPAAGFGTRFLPATKAQPKEMLPIVDTPTIQFAVEEAVKSGIEDILIITGKDKRAIEDYFDRSPELEALLARKGQDSLLRVVQEVSNLANVHYVRQGEPLGLGHAILCAKYHVGNEPFAVILADDVVKSEVPCLSQLGEVYRRTGASVLAVQRVPHQETRRYGIIDPESAGERLYRVKDMVEKPAPELAPSDLGVIGRYILTPDIFEILENTQPGVGGEIQLTDALRLLNRRRSIHALEFEGRRYDTGDKLGYLQATVDYALAREDLGAGFEAYLVEVLERRAAQNQLPDQNQRAAKGRTGP